MPYVAEVTSIKGPGWTGGLNREGDPFQLEENESPDALNVDFGLRGAVSKRKGYSKFSTADPAAFARGTHLINWTRFGGSNFFIYVDDDGDLGYTSGSILTDALIDFGAYTADSEYPIPAASLNNLLYLTTLRGAVAPRSFDGTTWTPLDIMVPDGLGGEFPKAAALVATHERIFAGNVEYFSGAAHRSRVHWSDPLLATTWQANSWIDFAPDNGQEITGLAVFAESIVVFKNRSMFVLGGTDPDSFTVYPVDQSLGTECPGTIVNVGPELFFFDHLSGVWKYDGSNFERIDDKISRYLLDGINEPNAYKSHAFVYRNRYFLCVPWGSDTLPSRTFVYDPRIKAWTEYDFGVSASAALDGVLYAVGPRSAIGIFELFDTQTDNGANINSYFYTPWMAPSTQKLRHRLRRLDIAFSALGDFNVTVDMFRDFSLDPYRSLTVNTDPQTSLWDTMLWDTDPWGTGVTEIISRTSAWGETFGQAQLKVSEAGAGLWQLNRLDMQISSRPRVRGA